MKKRFHLTSEGVRELQVELEEFLGYRRAVAERLKTAREFGDLAENAEYVSACQEQERVEGRIAQLEDILHRAKIIQKPKNNAKVRLGSVIKLRHKGQGKEFQVVGTMEADPLRGKISDESPIGKVLLGKRVGDAIQLKTSINTTVYRVTYIS